MKRLPIILTSVTFFAVAAGVSMTVMPSSQAQNTQAQTVAVTEQTVTFSIENMTCAMCPITVSKAMQGVDGVNSVIVDFETKKATVSFDNAATTAAQIGAASTNAGYPATPAS